MIRQSDRIEPDLERQTLRCPRRSSGEPHTSEPGRGRRSPDPAATPVPDWRMRVIRLLLFLCSVTLLDCAPGRGQESSPAPRECEHPQTTAAMRRCEIARYDQATAGMTAAYQALMTELDQGGQAKLRLAQNAWLKFRDAEADFQADSARGGTLAPLIRTSVLADLTESRREQLLKQAKQTAR